MAAYTDLLPNIPWNNVFRQLDIKSVCRCAQVDKTWKQRAEDDNLWRFFLECDFPKLCRVPSGNKAIYRKHFCYMKNATENFHETLVEKKFHPMKYVFSVKGEELGIDFLQLEEMYTSQSVMNNHPCVVTPDHYFLRKSHDVLRIDRCTGEIISLSQLIGYNPKTISHVAFNKTKDLLCVYSDKNTASFYNLYNCQPYLKLDGIVSRSGMTVLRHNKNQLVFQEVDSPKTFPVVEIPEEGKVEFYIAEKETIFIAYNIDNENKTRMLAYCRFTGNLLASIETEKALTLVSKMRLKKNTYIFSSNTSPFRHYIYHLKKVVADDQKWEIINVFTITLQVKMIANVETYPINYTFSEQYIALSKGGGVVEIIDSESFKQVANIIIPEHSYRMLIEGNFIIVISKTQHHRKTILRAWEITSGKLKWEKSLNLKYGQVEMSKTLFQLLQLNIYQDGSCNLLFLDLNSGKTIHRHSGSILTFQDDEMDNAMIDGVVFDVKNVITVRSWIKYVLRGGVEDVIVKMSKLTITDYTTKTKSSHKIKLSLDK